MRRVEARRLQLQRDLAMSLFSHDDMGKVSRKETVLVTEEDAFDVFLSHNSKDKPVVKALGEMLKRSGVKVWLDEWELVPGRPWQEALEEIIVTCRSAAVLVGKDGLET